MRSLPAKSYELLGSAENKMIFIVDLAKKNCTFKALNPGEVTVQINHSRLVAIITSEFPRRLKENFLN